MSRKLSEFQTKDYILKNLDNYALSYSYGNRFVDICWVSAATSQKEPESSYRLGYIKKSELTEKSYQEICQKIIEEILDSKKNYCLFHKTSPEYVEGRLVSVKTPIYCDRERHINNDGHAFTKEENKILEKTIKERNYQQIIANLEEYKFTQMGCFLWCPDSDKEVSDKDKFKLIASGSLTTEHYDYIKEKIVNDLIAEKEKWIPQYLDGLLHCYVKKATREEFESSMGKMVIYRIVYDARNFSDEQTTRLRTALNIDPKICIVQTMKNEVDKNPNSQKDNEFSLPDNEDYNRDKLPLNPEIIDKDLPLDFPKNNPKQGENQENSKKNSSKSKKTNVGLLTISNFKKVRKFFLDNKIQAIILQPNGKLLVQYNSKDNNGDKIGEEISVWNTSGENQIITQWMKNNGRNSLSRHEVMNEQFFTQNNSSKTPESSPNSYLLWLSVIAFSVIGAAFVFYKLISARKKDKSVLLK